MISRGKKPGRHPVRAAWVVLWIFLLIVQIPVPAFARQTVVVRSGDHPTFSRLVFDWQEQVSYRARIVGDRLEITFDKASIPQWGNFSHEPMAYLADPAYRIDGDRLVVSFRLVKPGRLKESRYGTKIAFDIIGDIIGTDEAPALKSAPGETPVADHPVKAAAVTRTPLDNNSDLKLGVRRTWDNLSLDFPWKDEVPAAVFTRYNHLWVIFDGKKNIDQSALAPFYGQRILSARQIDNPSMTILMYEVVPGQNVKVRKDGSEWYVDLKNSPASPAIPIQSSSLRVTGKKGESFFYSVEDTGSVLLLEDPDVGDEIAVIPVMAASQGVAQSRKFAQFHSLATAQGIAVALIADDVKLDKYNEGISVSASNGLALTRNRFSKTVGLSAASGQEMADGGKLVDFTRWAQGPLDTGDYYANKHELLYRLSNSTDANRDAARWKLARFYLANGREREAYGVLKVMQEGEPGLINSPEFRMVLAIDNILMRRFEEGVKLLHFKSFLTEKDVFLWRSVADDALGNYARAFADYKKGSAILSSYEPDRQKYFLFAATHAAYEMADRDFVEFSLSLLEKLPLTAAEMTEVEYWHAVLERDNGDLKKARESLESIVKAGVRQTAARAKFDLINMNLKDKKITIPAAIDQFEKLRFAWRGDDFELELLSRLGELYVQEKEYNTGLQTLKLAVTFFRDSKKTAELTRQMSRIYSDLFLKGGADDLDPVKAVALYSQFRELIPLGKDGDNMTRRLADRLVSLDLLDEAAALLKHQVKFRLKGGAQSVVASRLAMIYLLDSKPEKALKILRATRDSQIPADVQDRRRMIEARALIELGRYEEAEVLIEEYKTAEAEDMRSDIYWKSKNWDKYISHETRMLGQRYKDDTPLTPKERLSVLRLSLAYVIKQDKPGVIALRAHYKSYMDNGLYGDSFDVITAPRMRTDQDPRRLIKSIASVAQLKTFMQSYKAEFENGAAPNQTQR